MFLMFIFLLQKTSCSVDTQLWKERYISQEAWQDGFIKTPLQISSGDIGIFQCKNKCQSVGEKCSLFHFDKLTGDCILAEESSPMTILFSQNNSDIPIFVNGENVVAGNCIITG